MLPRRLPALAELLPVGPVRGAALTVQHHFPLLGTASTPGTRMLHGPQSAAWLARASAWHCRLPQHSLTACLLLQIAIAATDLAEIIGSATALYLLFGLPVWAGVLITGVVSTMLHPNLHQPSAVELSTWVAVWPAFDCLHIRHSGC